MTHQVMPVAMGVVMGPMMMWMLHGALTGDGPSGLALALFVGAHVLVLAMLLAAVLFAARLSPGLRARLDRLHRPSLQHVGLMFATATISAGLVHVSMHGFA